VPGTRAGEETRGKRSGGRGADLVTWNVERFAVNGGRDGSFRRGNGGRDYGAAREGADNAHAVSDVVMRLSGRASGGP